MSILSRGKSSIKAIISQKIKLAFQTYMASITKGGFLKTDELPKTPEFKLGCNIFPYMIWGI